MSDFRKVVQSSGVAEQEEHKNPAAKTPKSSLFGESA